MKLNQFIYQYTYSHQPYRDVLYPNYKKVGNIFILYQSEWTEKNVNIRNIVQRLHDEDKQVVSWGYCKKDKIESPILPESRIVGTHDFNWFQRPKSDLLQFLQQNKFDLLIDLTAMPVLPMQYVALHANAKFKIGIYDNALYDMVVNSSDSTNVEYNFQQIIHYLNLIKSAD